MMKRILVLTFAYAVLPGIGLLMAQLIRGIRTVSAATPAQANVLTSARMRQLVERYYAGVRSLNPEQYAANFAEDGTLEDPVGTPPASGREAVKEKYQPATLVFSEINMYPRDVFAPDFTNEAAVRWSATLKFRTGEVVAPAIFGITYFKFNNDGLILSARVFWYPTDLVTRTHP